MKPELTAPGTERLKLKFDGLVSNFAFEFNLRRYNQLAFVAVTVGCFAGTGQGLTLVHFSAQPEPFLTQNPPWTLHSTPKHPLNTH